MTTMDGDVIRVKKVVYVLRDRAIIPSQADRETVVRGAPLGDDAGGVLLEEGGIWSGWTAS